MKKHPFAILLFLLLLGVGLFLRVYSMRVRAIHQQARNQSLVRQVFFAVKAYQSDHDQKLPASLEEFFASSAYLTTEKVGLHELSKTMRLHPEAKSPADTLLDGEAGSSLYEVRLDGTISWKAKP